MKLKDVVRQLEDEVSELRAWKIVHEDFTNPSGMNGYYKAIQDERRAKAHGIEHAKLALADETATCHICGKRDFMDNLADVGWMNPQPLPDCSLDGAIKWMRDTHYAHPDCAGIRRSDDGKGWTKCKCKK